MQQELAALAVLIGRLFNAQELLIKENQDQRAEIERLNEALKTAQPVASVDPPAPPVVQ